MIVVRIDQRWDVSLWMDSCVPVRSCCRTIQACGVIVHTKAFEKYDRFNPVLISPFNNEDKGLVGGTAIQRRCRVLVDAHNW